MSRSRQAAEPYIVIERSLYELAATLKPSEARVLFDLIRCVKEQARIFRFEELTSPLKPIPYSVSDSSFRIARSTQRQALETLDRLKVLKLHKVGEGTGSTNTIQWQWGIKLDEIHQASAVEGPKLDEIHQASAVAQEPKSDLDEIQQGGLTEFSKGVAEIHQALPPSIIQDQDHDHDASLDGEEGEPEPAPERSRKADPAKPFLDAVRDLAKSGGSKRSKQTSFARLVCEHLKSTPQQSAARVQQLLRDYEGCTSTLANLVAGYIRKSRFGTPAFKSMENDLESALAEQSHQKMHPAARDVIHSVSAAVSVK